MTSAAGRPGDRGGGSSPPWSRETRSRPWSCQLSGVVGGARVRAWSRYCERRARCGLVEIGRREHEALNAGACPERLHDFGDVAERDSTVEVAVRLDRDGGPSPADVEAARRARARLRLGEAIRGEGYLERRV